jgi:gas vesicle protein
MATEDKDRDTGFDITAAAFGAGLGIIAGAVMGVLFAPKSGTETRAQLGDWLKDKRDQGSNLLARVKEEGMHRKAQLAAAINKHS